MPIDNDADNPNHLHSNHPHSYEIGFNPQKFEQIYVVRRITKGTHVMSLLHPNRHIALPTYPFTRPSVHPSYLSNKNNSRTHPGWIFRAYPGPYKAYLDAPDGSCELVKVYEKGEVPRLRDVSKFIREESTVCQCGRGVYRWIEGGR